MGYFMRWFIATFDAHITMYDVIKPTTRSRYCSHIYSVLQEAFTEALQTLNDGYNLIIPKTYTS